MFVSVVIAVVIVLIVITILVAVSVGKKNSASKLTKSVTGAVSKKEQAMIIRDANRRLAKDPKDPEGLMAVGNVYFNNKLWEKAEPVYIQLTKVAVERAQVDAFQANQRAGICCFMNNKLKDALGYLIFAEKINPHDFECNYYLGQALYKNKAFDQAASCFKKALIAKQDAEGIYFQLGKALYSAHHYQESLPCLKKALDEDPANKEALFYMADAMNEQGAGEKAIKVLMHLRPDPVYGARSCLEAGMYHTKVGDTEGAIQDFEIGLKLENAEPEVRLELQYRLAAVFFGIGRIPDGLNLLKQIRMVNANYKDVNSLISRYQELSSNKNLQIYLTAGTSDFVALCRKVIINKYKGSYVKIQDINVGPLYTDIIAEIETDKWENTDLFRFFRTNGATGELYVRDFHGHLQDIKADKGYCLTAGTFTEEARKYTEGRPLDLIEKSELTKILKTING